MLSFSLESNEIMVTSNLNLLIFSRESNRDFSLGHVTVCASWKVQPTFFKFVVCNPCYSSSSLTILVPLWFIIISLVFFYLNKLLFSGFFNLTVILYVAKITLTALPAFRKRPKTTAGVWGSRASHLRITLTAPPAFRKRPKTTVLQPKNTATLQSSPPGIKLYLAKSSTCALQGSSSQLTALSFFLRWEDLQYSGRTLWRRSIALKQRRKIRLW